MAIVDVHAHIYPDKIAARAAESIEEFYGLKRFCNGTVDNLLKIQEQSEITHFVVHSAAVKAKTVQPIDDFIAGEVKKHPQFIGFGAMHQDYESPEAEIDRMASMGLRGIKMHPDSQEVYIDDPRMMEIYDICEEKGMRLVLHCGDIRSDYSHPKHLVNVLHEFPELTIDAAHFGGWLVFDYALEYLRDESCFMDIASSMMILGPQRTRELIEIYGADRILFGADFPTWSPAEELEHFRALGLSRKEEELILWHNAERFLGMDLS